MQVIDAHQHFWIYDQIRDGWITDEMSVIQRSFLPEDLKPVLKENNVLGCVAIQADQSESETRFLLELSDKNDFIKGVVGWIDLRDKEVSKSLDKYAGYKKLKGFRHIVQAENAKAFLQNNHFINGIKALSDFQYTYDILVYTHQLPYVSDFISKFSDQPFILDHMGKPDIRNNGLKQWEKQIKILTKFPNLYCKISGLVTEAHWDGWTDKEMISYIDVAVQNFGTDRVVFGSDWPVCLLASTYGRWKNLLTDYFGQFTKDQQEGFFYKNAVRFYKL